MIKRNHLTFLLKIHLIFFSLQFCVIQKFHSQVQNTENLPFPIQNNYDPTQTQKQRFDLGDPGNVKQTIVYDPITGKYIFKETYGIELIYFGSNTNAVVDFLHNVTVVTDRTIGINSSFIILSGNKYLIIVILP